MDALSSIIDVASIRGSLDLRCQMAGRFTIPHERAEPGEAIFHLMLAGAAQIKVTGGPALKLVAGDLVLLPRGAAHALRGIGKHAAPPVHLDSTGPLLKRVNAEDGAEMDLLCGRFSYTHGPADLLMTALPDVLHVSLTSEDSIDAINGVVGLLRTEVMHMRSGALAVVTSLMQVLLVMALRIYTQREHISPSLLGLLGDPRLSTAILSMIRKPYEPWTVEALAKVANMSRATFARQVSEKGAMSPMDLLTTIRIHLSCGLLQTTDLVLADVAERVGYQSGSAFTKVFRKRMGMTPFAYRKGTAP